MSELAALVDKITARREEVSQDLSHADKEVKRLTGVSDDGVRHYRGQHHYLSGIIVGYTAVLTELEELSTPTTTPGEDSR